jgi:hypothetical protein
MAHFAEIDSDNIVLRVVVVPNEHETNGQDYLANEIGLGGTWIQTSYNNNIRKNYASAGYTYDSTRDAFIAPKRFPSWVLNEDTCKWEAPVPRPIDNKEYDWDEATLNWVEVPTE